MTRPPIFRYAAPPPPPPPPLPYVRCFSSMRADRVRYRAASGVRRNLVDRPDIGSGICELQVRGWPRERRHFVVPSPLKSARSEEHRISRRRFSAPELKGATRPLRPAGKLLLFSARSSLRLAQSRFAAAKRSCPDGHGLGNRSSQRGRRNALRQKFCRTIRFHRITTSVLEYTHRRSNCRNSFALASTFAAGTSHIGLVLPGNEFRKTNAQNAKAE